MDGTTEERRGTISVFNGPEPVIQVEKTPAAEAAAAGTWLKERVAEGLKPHEIAVFVRTSRSPTTPTWTRSTTRNATSSTSPAPAPATNF